VIDFPIVPTGMDSSGPYLADELSAALENRLPAGTIIPRDKLRKFLKSHELTQMDLQSISLAYGAGEEVDANEILYGELLPTDVEIALHLRLLRLSDSKEVAKWDLKLEPTNDLKSLLGKPLEIPVNPLSSNLPLKCSYGDPKLATKAFQESGGTLPTGIFMPNPPYSDEARKEKYSGTRRYDVYLNSGGALVLIVPQFPLRPEVDGIAVETLKRWKFRPATQNGRPVAVCVTMEVTWRLY